MIVYYCKVLNYLTNYSARLVTRLKYCQKPKQRFSSLNNFKHLKLYWVKLFNWLLNTLLCTCSAQVMRQTHAQQPARSRVTPLTLLLPFALLLLMLLLLLPLSKGWIVIWKLRCAINYSAGHLSTPSLGESAYRGPFSAAGFKQA